MVERRAISAKRVLPGAGLWAAEYGFDVRHMKSPLQYGGCTLEWKDGETEIALEDRSGRQRWELDESSPSYLILRLLSIRVKDTLGLELEPRKSRRFVLPIKDEFRAPWDFHPLDTSAFPQRRVGQVDYDKALDWGHSRESVDQGIATLLQIGRRVRSSLKNFVPVPADLAEIERIVYEYKHPKGLRFPKVKYSPLTSEKIRESLEKRTRELMEEVDRVDAILFSGFNSKKLDYPVAS